MPDARQQQVAARGQGLQQPGHDRVRLIVLDDEVQGLQQQDRDRLGEIQVDHRARVMGGG